MRIISAVLGLTYFCMLACYGATESPLLPAAIINVDRLTEEAFPEDYLAWFAQDAGYDKWLLRIFHITGHPPFTLLQKRSGDGSDTLKPLGELNQDIFSIAKKDNKSANLCVSVKGFMPGEKVSFRFQAKEKNNYSEISFYPRPLLVRRSNGEILLQAELRNVEPTIYGLEISGVGLKEKYIFYSQSGDEKLAQSMQGPTSKDAFNYMPGVIGQLGGIAKVAIRFGDRSLYKLNLPWGSELVKYQKGAKD